ncbi:unnamed protein product [Lactuca saligna]|uniref:Uncharacterized protein n=1 Tax=Lactuca saligna TaxID=75948 RepID=A0AA35VB25_LACSI|nr:unnamed protein product [Lactuca saligna]
MGHPDKKPVGYRVVFGYICKNRVRIWDTMPRSVAIPTFSVPHLVNLTFFKATIFPVSGSRALCTLLYIVVFSKTKDSKKVYMLHFEREALVSGSGSGSKRTWRTYGSLRVPMKDELQLAPGGSFTKVMTLHVTMQILKVNQGHTLSN